jgi:KaiC/GvpD/RAD55 family RecA-like ATPase
MSPGTGTGKFPAPDPRALILVVERNPIVQRLEKYLLVILLWFQSGRALKRTWRIIKTRGSAHDSREHELTITPAGVVIKEFES